MWRLQQNLKLLSNRLSDWSRNVIGDMYQNVKEWEEKIQALEEVELITNMEQNREDLNKSHAEYGQTGISLKTKSSTQVV